MILPQLETASREQADTQLFLESTVAHYPSADVTSLMIGGWPHAV